mgnify:CR=1 FL=1
MFGLVPFKFNNGENSRGLTINDMFNDFFNDDMLSEFNSSGSFKTDIKETPEEYIVHAELPGVKKEDLDIDIDKNHITINAKKEEENKEDTKGYRKSEFRYGEFSRTVYFPQEIDVEKTSAKLEHGILRIEAPKLAAEKEGIKKLTVN